MILRSLLLRHGRLALPKSPSPVRSWRRYLASEVEATYTNPHEAQQYVAGAIGGSKSQAIEAATSNDNAADDQIARDWAFFHHQKAVTGHLGSTIAPHYKPHELLSNPPKPQDITLELLMASQAHIGHSTSLWHPANAKYIFGVRGGKGEDPIHIISLDVTAAYLRRACKVVSGVTERGGLVLFVGSREGQARAVVKAAEMAKGCHLFTKWIPGTITNGQQILGKCRKKVIDTQTREEVEGFEDQLVHKAVVKPDLVVCLNPLENYILLHECGLNNIPTIGIVDTDVNPTWVTYPIPANDDSLRCVQVIAGVLGNAGAEGYTARERNGTPIARQDHGLRPPREKEEGTEERPQEIGQSLLQQAEAFDIAALEEVEEPQVEGAGTGDERLAVGVDRSLTGEQEVSAGDEANVPYERDAPIEGGADTMSSTPHEAAESSAIRDEGDWPVEKEQSAEEWRKERP